MAFTRKRLLAILGLHATPTGGYTVDHQTTGLGGVSPWRALNGHRSYFTKLSGQGLAAKAPQKIIFSAEIFGTLEEVDLKLFAGLYAHFEIYLWDSEHPDSPLRGPFKNRTNLLSALRAQPAKTPCSSATVKKYFADLNRASDDYYVIDTVLYQSLVRRASTTQNLKLQFKPHHLDLTEAPKSAQQEYFFKKAFNLVEITQLTISLENISPELEKLLNNSAALQQLFPRLKKIKLLDMSMTRLDILERLSGLEVECILNASSPPLTNKIVLNTDLKGLTLSFDKETEKRASLPLSFSLRDKSLEKITYNLAASDSVDIIAPQLREISLCPLDKPKIQSAAVRKFKFAYGTAVFPLPKGLATFKQFNQIEELEIEGMIHDLPSDIKKENIKILKLHCKQFMPSFSPGVWPLLEELHINTSRSIGVLVLDNFPKLRILKIDNPECDGKNSSPLPDVVISSKHSTLEQCSITGFDLGGFSKTLKNIEIKKRAQKKKYGEKTLRISPLFNTNAVNLPTHKKNKKIAFFITGLDEWPYIKTANDSHIEVIECYAISNLHNVVDPTKVRVLTITFDKFLEKNKTVPSLDVSLFPNLEVLLLTPTGARHDSMIPLWVKNLDGHASIKKIEARSVLISSSKLSLPALESLRFEKVAWESNKKPGEEPFIIENCPLLRRVKIKKLVSCEFSVLPEMAPTDFLLGLMNPSAVLRIGNCPQLTYLEVSGNYKPDQDLRESVVIEGAVVNLRTDLRKNEQSPSSSASSLKGLGYSPSLAEIQSFMLSSNASSSSSTSASDQSPKTVSILGRNLSSNDFDGNTGEIKNEYKASGEFKLEIKALDQNVGISTTQVRLGLCNYLKIVNGPPEKIAIFRHSQKTEEISCSLAPIEEMKEDLSEKNRSCTFQGTFVVGQKYPLATNCPLDKNRLPKKIYCDAGLREQVTIIWDEEDKYASFVLPASFKRFAGKTVNFVYYYQEEERYLTSYQKGSPAQLPQQVPAKLSDRKELYQEWRPFLERLKPALENLEKAHPLAKVLFNEKLSTHEKLQAIYNFCHAMTAEELVGTPLEKVGFNAFLNSIRQKKGVCRHRAMVFMALAALVDVETHVPDNEEHAFVEIVYLENGQRKMKGYDLGGGTRLDKTPAEKRRLEKLPVPLAPASHQENLNRFSADEKAATEPPRPIASVIDEQEDRQLSLELNKNQARNYYKQAFMTQQKKPAISNVELFFKDLKESRKASLIKLKSTEEILSVKAQLSEFLQTEKSPYLYIHSPKDFDLFWSPPRMEQGVFKCVDDENTPLRKLMREGGTLIVNWSTFTPQEMAIYKAIMDEKPNVFNQEAAENFRVVGLTTNEQGSRAFLSRCKAFSSTLQAQPRVATAEPESKIASVDLYEDPLWQDSMFGEITLPNTLGLGLLTAREEKTEKLRVGDSLIVNNPPRDPDFTEMVNRLNTDHWLLINGERINFPPTFKIIVPPNSFAKEKDKDQTPPLAFIQKPRLPTGEVVYLGLYNWLNLFKDTAMIDGKPTTRPGWLKDHDHFCLLEPIPLVFQKKLASHIALHYPHKKFTFSLAPKPITLKNNSAPATHATASVIEAKLETQVYVSNDADYCAQKLQKRLNTSLEELKQEPDTILINIKPSTALTDLLATQTLSDGLNQGRFQETEILKALRNGKKVIVNGAISRNLYFELLAIQKTKRILINGQALPISGELYMVLPEKTALPLFEARQEHFDLEAYKKVFQDELQKKNPSNLDQQLKKMAEQLEAIKNWLSLAQKLTDKTPGMPPLPQLSYQWLKQFLSRLAKEPPRHANNPLKGVFLYHYPRDSEEYAYLNVMAKILFNSPQTESKGNRQIKACELLARYQNKSSQFCLWRLLNCLDVRVLREVLKAHSSFEVDEALRTAIYTQIASHLQSPESKSKNSENDPFKKVGAALRQQLAVEDEHLTVVIGEAGVGKTHLLSSLSADQYTIYSSEKEEEWAKDTSDKIKVLVLDEGNMAQPGELDSLKDVALSKTYFSKGIRRALSPRHKVVVLGNPPGKYPNRYHHDYLQQYGETIYFRLPSDEVLAEKIAQPILSPEIKSHSKNLIKAINLVRQYNPHLVKSIRDVEHLSYCCEYVFCQQQKTAADKSLLIAEVCLMQLIGCIAEPSQQIKFREALERLFGVNLPPVDEKGSWVGPPDNKIFIPTEKIPILEALHLSLDMREQKSGTDTVLPFKRGIALQGDAGTGKTSVFEKVLLEKGVPFVKITAGMSNARETLISAYREGKVVVLDEFDLDPSLETLINQLLDPNNKLHKTDDSYKFRIFASKNPSSYQGHGGVSQATLNRYVFFNYDHSDLELEKIAEANHIFNPQEFVREFKASFATEREFFELLKIEAAKQAPYFNIMEIVHSSLNKQIERLEKSITGCFTKSTETKILQLRQGYREIVNIIADQLANNSSPDQLTNSVVKKLDALAKQKDICRARNKVGYIFKWLKGIIIGLFVGYPFRNTAYQNEFKNRFFATETVKNIHQLKKELSNDLKIKK